LDRHEGSGSHHLENTTDTKAVYGFDSIEIGDKWLLNLGLRWDDYSVDGVTAGVPVAEASWEFVNYQVGLVYKPTRNTSVYASVSTSSTPPTTQGGDGNSSATPVQSDPWIRKTPPATKSAPRPACSVNSSSSASPSST
jgi:outer membrane receptor for monomeric catechols